MSTEPQPSLETSETVAPTPAAPTPAVAALVETAPGELVFVDDDRRYRIRGLEKNISAARLRVNVKVDRLDAVHVDCVDLYSDRQRQRFVKRTSEELYVDERLVKRDLARLLRALEEFQLAQIADAPAAAAPVMTADEERQAIGLLEDPELLARIGRDFETCGLAGEETNRLVCYLAATSRLLDKPLSILVQSASASGKTTLVDATLAFMPAEAQVKLSALTGQSLYYMGPDALRHKILAIAEDEGVAHASYALKLLQSEGKLALATTEKDPGSGRQRTRTYEVAGPVAMLLTTTSEAPDPELENRCLALHVDESAAQTAAVHARQRARYALDGPHVDAAAKIRTVHQNAQRLLAPLGVVMPWAEKLAFRTDQPRMRRDQTKYLALIAAHALLHQRQRARIVRKNAAGADEPCVVARLADLAAANWLLGAACGAAPDELLPQTRRLLELACAYVAAEAQREGVPRLSVRFTQRALREALGWSDRQLRRHLQRLVELEYVLAYRTGQGNGRAYQLVYDAPSGGESIAESPSTTLGLVDPAALAACEPAAPGPRTGGRKGRTGGHPAANRRASGAPPAAAENGATPGDAATCAATMET